MTAKTPQVNGLARWRQKQAEDKEERIKALDKLRESATTVTRDGQEFQVVTIPDKYVWGVGD